MPNFAFNKTASFNYNLSDHHEAGVVLTGPEVKSVKNGQVQLKGSYVTLRNGSAYLVGAHIAPYKQASDAQQKYNPTRDRKLLLHQKELQRLAGQLTAKGLTIVPTKVYSKAGLVKVEIAIGQPKKKFDKRQTIKKRELDRSLRAALRQ